MTLEKEPFQSTIVDGERDRPDTFTIRFNKAERANLEEDKKILEQSKDGTAVKILVELGRNVLHDKKTGLVIRAIFKNKSKNKRLGIVDFD